MEIIVYQLRTFLLSLIVVFVFVVLQNLGVNLSWGGFFTNKTSAVQTQVEKAKSDVNVIQTGNVD